MKMAVGSCCLLTVAICTPLPAANPLAAGKEEVVRFQSEVSRGQDFRDPIGHGLLLTLPGGDGWVIADTLVSNSV